MMSFFVVGLFFGHVPPSLFLPPPQQPSYQAHERRIVGIQLKPLILWIGSVRYVLQRCHIQSCKQGVFTLRSQILPKKPMRDTQQGEEGITFSIGQILNEKDVAFIKVCTSKSPL